MDTESDSLGNRLYGLYLGVLLVVWLWLMWGAAFDIAFGFGETLGPPTREALRASLTLLPIGALVALAIGTLRSSPVKFFSADMAYVAGTPVSRAAVAAVWSTAGTIKAALVGGAFAALSCAVLAEAATSPLAFRACAPAAALGGLLAVGAYAWSWALGLARVSVRPEQRGRGLALPVAVALCAAAFALLPLAWTPESLLALLQGGLPRQMAPALVAALAGVAAVPLAARRLDTPRVVEESGLFARLSRFEALRLYDSAMFADIRRRAKFAMRPPHGRMLEAVGPLAITARSWVSHRRQYSTLLTPLLWGGMIVPAGVQLAATADHLTLIFPWLFILLVTPARALVQAFRDDLDRPGLRTMLPYDSLTLLCLDALPTTALMLASSGVALAFIAQALVSPAGSVALTLALDLAIVACAALEVIPLGTSGRTIAFALSAIVVAGIALLTARFVGPWPGALIALGLTAVIALMVRESRD